LSRTREGGIDHSYTINTFLYVTMFLFKVFGDPIHLPLPPPPPLKEQRVVKGNYEI
jgi:hypothetical protein